MKLIFKILLRAYLKMLAKIRLALFRPTVIAIAGSTNKTITKNAVAAALGEAGVEVRAGADGFNTDIGLSLAILNLPSGYNSYHGWLPVMLAAPARIFKKDARYLILEFGISDAGDMAYLLSIVRPHIAVITDITQRHREGFENMNELFEEYHLFARKTNDKGMLVVNNDNLRTKKLTATASHPAAFGFSQDSAWQISIIEKKLNQTSVLVNTGTRARQYEINRPGEHNVYAFVISLIIADYVSKKEQEKLL